MDSYTQDRLVALKKFAAEFKVRPDWHEPDNQNVTAVVTGKSLDNAMGEDQEGLPPYYQELVVHLFVDDSFKLSINLATLLAIAADHALEFTKTLDTLTTREVDLLAASYGWSGWEHGHRLIPRVKAVREITKSSLREAKDWVESHF